MPISIGQHASSVRIEDSVIIARSVAEDFAFYRTCAIYRNSSATQSVSSQWVLARRDGRSRGRLM